MKHKDATEALAASITRAASKQTYLTIRLLADRDRCADAYRAYAYFRWVDDRLDAPRQSQEGRTAFLHRQQSLLEGCYRGESAVNLLPEEELLAKLVRHDPDRQSGLHTYLDHMMKVMAFDAERRGRLISNCELEDYTRWLASAVTEAVHYFIGHDCQTPHDEARYLAVSGAHITHMLRDALEDAPCGYFNIPREVLESGSFSPEDVGHPAYRDWVKGRVKLAREYFRQGRSCLRRIQNPRCRLAEVAYISRFENVLDLIEKDGYQLRQTYPELTASSALWRALLTVIGSFADRIPDHLAASLEARRERYFRSS